MRFRFRPGRAFVALRAEVAAIRRDITPKPPTSGDARERRQFKKLDQDQQVAVLIGKEMQR